MNSYKIIFLLLIILLISAKANEKEDTLKGVILEKVSQFITYKSEKKDFTICIYENSAIYDSLTQLYKEKKYKQLPIKVLDIKKKENFHHCDIFYTSKINKTIAHKIKNDPLEYTLLVSDSIENLKKGFILALYTQDKKIKIAINQEALSKTKLKVNYRLLQVASKIIHPVKVK